MNHYRQYKKVIKQHNISSTYYNFNSLLEEFLNKIINKNINTKIEHIIQHNTYSITIIYSVLEEIKENKNN